MTAPDRYQRRRDKDALGVCEHRGNVAVAGVGHSAVDRDTARSETMPKLILVPDALSKPCWDAVTLIHGWRVVA